MQFKTRSFDALPESAFIREAQLVQSPKRPAIPAPLPFSAGTLWRMVKKRTFPQPIKLSERVTAWNVGEVRAWIAAQSQGDGSATEPHANLIGTFGAATPTAVNVTTSPPPSRASDVTARLSAQKKA